MDAPKYNIRCSIELCRLKNEHKVNTAPLSCQLVEFLKKFKLTKGYILFLLLLVSKKKYVNLCRKQ